MEQLVLNKYETKDRRQIVEEYLPDGISKSACVRARHTGTAWRSLHGSDLEMDAVNILRFRSRWIIN